MNRLHMAIVAALILCLASGECRLLSDAFDEDTGGGSGDSSDVRNGWDRNATPDPSVPRRSPLSESSGALQTQGPSTDGARYY